MGTTTDDDDATDDGRSAVVGRSTTAGAKQKMKVNECFTGLVELLCYYQHTHSNIIITASNFVLKTAG